MSELEPALQTALAGAYTVQRELGGGGMSRVFVAVELALGRTVVLKVLPPEVAAGVNADRFRREIQVAASMQHPHIVPLLSAGQASGLFYYVMPLVEGESLRTRLSRAGELPVPDAVRILRDVADALTYAHGRGVVHRDIKPDNVLVSGSHALVTDFGVAKALTESSGAGGTTTAGVALGTPAYMAPEQASADPRVDHRADIYALGAMAYEMLTGRPPFVGSSTHQILAAQVSQAPEPITKYRPAVPGELAAAVMRCLEKNPADRWQTAVELLHPLEAMATPSGSAVPATQLPRTTPAASGAVGAPGRRLTRTMAWTAATSGILVAALLVLRARTPRALDPDLVAVAPFDVLSSNLALWREGLVDLLSRSLDGAGPLRTVPPTIVIRRWNGRADPASAAGLARETGAGLSVFGQLLAVQDDSVRLSATVFDHVRGGSLAELELRGTATSMDQLADSLALGILAELGRSRPIGAVRLVASGSRSLPALKAFLKGEQHFRRTEWDSAAAEYQRALALDSGLALAWRRLGNVAGWQRQASDSLALAARLRAGALNHALAPRESLLVRADSIMAAREKGGPDSLVPVLLGTLAEAARRYPSDPEIAYDLGEAYFHHGREFQSRRQSLQAFDRAIALDSTFAPSYIHPVALALEFQDPLAARRYIRAYLATGPTDRHAEKLRFIDLMLDPARVAERRTALDTARSDLLGWAYSDLGNLRDKAETAVLLARRQRPRIDTLRFAGALPFALAARGHVREALGYWRDPGDLSAVFSDAALLGIVPAESARPVFERWRRERRAAAAVRYWAQWGDTSSLAAYVRDADSTLRAGGPPDQLPFRRYRVARDRAYLALARRDSSDALRRFTALVDSTCLPCHPFDALARAQVLAAAGRDREAALQLDQARAFWNLSGTPSAVFWMLERGRVNERLGNRETAIESYGYVVESWRRPDPELEPYAREARDALRRLGTEPRP